MVPLCIQLDYNNYGGFWTIFFLLGVLKKLNTKKKDFLREKCLGELGALGEIIFILARRMGRNTRFDMRKF